MSRYTVSLRGGFSDRNKIKSENTTIQTTELDERTRVALVTATDIVITHGILFCDYYGSDFEQDFLKHVMADVYGHCVYWENHYTRKTVLPIIYDTIKTDTYDAVLTVIEFVAREISNGCPSGFVFENKRYTSFGFFNRILEREYVGYRFVGGYITPITDSVEIKTIDEAVSAEHNSVREHIEKALRLLSDRESPDYANSIKESISAVERMCSIIMGKSTTLGDALSKLQSKGVTINSQMKSAFDKLYAYTNGASGIRHAGQLDGPDATFAEAKFMLVSCSAFVNYLTEVMAD